jgi:RHS repeat-associated protein
MTEDFIFDRGYTGHEHLDAFGLINMNGRAYDPLVARFLSPDPVMQQPGNTQNHNGYSYVLNNPLKYTDPSGYSFMGFLDKFIRWNLNILTIPGRFYGGSVEWLNDKINGTPDPNGYFSAEYILGGILPAPDAGFEHLFDSQSLSTPYGNTGGFTSADGSFYSNDELAKEAWAHREARRQALEQGDFNNIDLIATMDYNKGLDYDISHSGGDAMCNCSGIYGYPPVGDGKEDDTKSKIYKLQKSSNWVVNTAEASLSFMATDALFFEPTDLNWYKWAGYGVATLVFGTILYIYDEPFPKPWHTSRGEPIKWGNDPVIQGFENDKFYGNEPPPPFYWPLIGGTMTYELYNNWPKPNIEEADTISNSVVKPNEN